MPQEPVDEADVPLGLLQLLVGALVAVLIEQTPLATLRVVSGG